MRKWRFSKAALFNSVHFWAIVIFAVNLTQAYFTNVHDDEAYYWLFSKHLDWGFFDHPPMVAVFVKISDFLFNGALSIRGLTVVTSVLVWYLFVSLLQNKSIRWLGVSFLALPILQLYGFITTPDVPLILFGILFLKALLSFLENKKWSWILLGLSMALLAYSKYHGALIVGFALIPTVRKQNILKLVLAGALALLLFMPHLLWQYQNDWPSFQYHLISRHKGFNFTYLNEYLLACLIIPGVFSLWVFKWSEKLNKWPLSKSLKYIYWGFLIFFALMLFKGKIELHWLAFAGIAAFLLALKSDLIEQKWFKTTLLVQFSMLFIARITLVLFGQFQIESFSKSDIWAENIENLAKNKPVVFMNSFQKAAKYEFYTGNTSWSDNNRFLRKNQFDIWKHDTLLKGKTVYYISNYNKGAFIQDTLTDGGFGGVIEQFIPAQRIKGDFTNFKLDKIENELVYKTELTIHNPYPYAIDLYNESMPMRFYGWFITDSLNKVIKLTGLDSSQAIIPKGISRFDLALKTNNPAFVNAASIKIVPILMKGPLFGQSINNPIEAEIVNKK